ncbi:MAG: excinuclease ABC subunit UvrA, partial [Propionibacterium sp.]|nr:excinuclease ABC subunit UvrA [Propionibacterium sp.]
MTDQLVVRGARVHNLKNLSIDLPRDSLIVFTGLSGSGKSSLAFDTIFAEGQRRYVESLSSYARMFLGQMDKPDVDFIDGLSPAVSIDQKSTSRNPRSTVGTITEVYDYLRLLYARIGVPHCQVCGAPIGKQTPQQIVDRLMALEEGTRFQILAPLVRGRKGEFADIFRQLLGDGYARVRIDGEIHQLTDLPKIDKRRKHDLEVIVDRAVVRPTAQQRITESVETALELAGGVVAIDFVDLPADDPEREKRYSEKLGCPNDHDVHMEELEPRQFSFNGPWGACPGCTGIGSVLDPDPELLIPDEDLSLAEGAIAPWNNAHIRGHYEHVLTSLSEEHGFSTDTPWKQLSAPTKKILLHGVPGAVVVKYRNRFGRMRSFSQKYEGIIPFIRRRHDEAETDSARERWGAYMQEVACSSCDGDRLKPSSLAVTVHGMNIASLVSMSIAEAAEFLKNIELTKTEATIAERVIKEILERLNFLLDVGLDYLTLSRAAATLSGGEAQRIRLATQIGSGLVGVLYVLDEPSIGLHQRDNLRLIGTLERLRNMGNTLIVVEHDEDTIRAADWVVDIGPGAGELGGEIVVSGPLDELLASSESKTGRYLSGQLAIDVPAVRRPGNGQVLKVTGARHNNLREVDVEFPLGKFITVTGVSGSGKSSLVNGIVYPAAAKAIYNAKAVPGKHKKILGLEHLDKVIQVDQSPIGRTPRSNPATYTGVFDRIRGLFAQTP